jgi:putative iron-regulated protein
MIAKKCSLVLLVAVSGCSVSDPVAQVVHQYAVNLHANYQDVVVKLQALQTAVNAFVAAPTADGFTAAQQAWLAARPAYGECEVSRFYGGPIDQLQGGMNEWPIDETFIDYTVDNPNGGIINDPVNYPLLTPQVLATSDEKGGIENLSTGFHAIEFLLWGQRPDQTGGAGQRLYTDYVDGEKAPHPDRRRTYLKAATDLLLQNMQGLTNQWDLTQPQGYAAKLVAGSPHDGLTKMLRGMSNMAIAELQYERLSDPYVTQARKDEESCFSESTWIDLNGNALGVEDVYLGRYQQLKGPSVSQLVKAKKPALDAQLQSTLAAIRAALAAIPQPFDHAVIAPAGSDAHDKVKAALDAFMPLQSLLEQMVATLGVQVNI